LAKATAFGVLRTAGKWQKRQFDIVRYRIEKSMRGTGRRVQEDDKVLLVSARTGSPRLVADGVGSTSAVLPNLRSNSESRCRIPKSYESLNGESESLNRRGNV
jgi:hypothetical protein